MSTTIRVPRSFSYSLTKKLPMENTAVPLSNQSGLNSSISAFVTDTASLTTSASLQASSRVEQRIIFLTCGYSASMYSFMALADLDSGVLPLIFTVSMPGRASI